MLEAPGSNPPKNLERIQPTDIHAGDIIYIKRPRLHVVDDKTRGNVRDMNEGYYRCEIKEVLGRLVVVNQEPIPSFPPGHQKDLPIGTELPTENLDPNELYQEAA
jgi:hypothetical protein